jgi:hypothetical protein
MHNKARHLPGEKQNKKRGGSKKDRRSVARSGTRLVNQHGRACSGTRLKAPRPEMPTNLPPTVASSAQGRGGRQACEGCLVQDELSPPRRSSRRAPAYHRFFPSERQMNDLRRVAHVQHRAPSAESHSRNPGFFLYPAARQRVGPAVCDPTSRETEAAPR